MTPNNILNVKNVKIIKGNKLKKRKNVVQKNLKKKQNKKQK